MDSTWQTLDAASGAASSTFGDGVLVDATEYALAEEVARGGIGRIVRARDERLGRDVAVKVLLGGSASARMRFEREAMITAELQHPAIVPLYQAGMMPDGQPYYAMKLVDGTTLAEAFERRPRLSDRLDLLTNLSQAMEAMAYAHSKGIIHRDLKPSNILLGAFGETVVIDWGLAKRIGDAEIEGSPARSDDSALQTLHGTILGTPAYMPVEQAAGEEVDSRADVYALGAVLYHLVAGSAPYDGGSEASLRALALAAPEPIERRCPAVPLDLALIVRKAMARDKADRYADAGALLEDIRRFSKVRMVSARKYGPVARTRLFLRRNRAASAVAAVAALVLIVASGLSIDRILQERNRANERARKLTLVQAKTAVDKDPTASLAWLKTYPRDALAKDEDAYRALLGDAISRGVSRHVLNHGLKVEHGGFTPGGRFAYTLTDHHVFFFDVRSGQQVRAVVAEDPLEAFFTQDGRRMVMRGRRGALIVAPGVDPKTGDLLDGPVVHYAGDRGWTWDHAIVEPHHAALPGRDGNLRLVDLRKAADAAGAVDILSAYTAPMVAVHASPDGRWVAGADERGVVRVHDRQDGTTREFVMRALYLRFCLDGAALFAFLEDGTIRHIDVSTGVVRDFLDMGARPEIVAVHPDAEHIAVGGRQGELFYFSALTAEHRRFDGHDDEILSIDFSKDGRRMVSGGLDKVVRVTELQSGYGRPLFGHSGIIESVAMSSDGQWVLSTSQDETARVWPVAPDGTRILTGHRDDINAVVFSPDGRFVATGGQDREVRVWNRETGAVQVLEGGTNQVYFLAFAPNSRWLAAAGYDPQIRVWPIGPDGAAVEQRRILRGHKGSTPSLTFSPDSTRLASSNADGTIRLFDIPSGAGRVVQEYAEGGTTWVSFSPDGRLLASTGDSGELVITELKSGTTRRLQGHTDISRRVFFSPDGTQMVSSSWDTTLRIWDVASGTSKVLTGHTGRVRAVQWAPDGRTIASASADQTVRLWDPVTGDNQIIGRHDAYTRWLWYAPDSKLLLTLSWDRTARLWDVERRVLRGVERHYNLVMSTAFSPDANLALQGETAVVGYERTLTLRPLTSFASLPRDRHALTETLEGWTTATINEQNAPQTAVIRATTGRSP